MSAAVPPGIERVLFTEEQIDSRIRELAAEISARYAGRPLKLIGVLKGSIFFLTALARHRQRPRLLVGFAAGNGRSQLLEFAGGVGAAHMVALAQNLRASAGAHQMVVQRVIARARIGRAH